MTTNTKHYKMFIGGEWVNSSDGSILEAINPYTERPWATVPEATEVDVDSAVCSARAAFGGPWRGGTPVSRARLLRKLGQLVEENVDELARVQVTENGKLIREVFDQTRGLADYCYFYAGAAEHLHGHTLPVSVPGMMAFTLREPIGVVAAIAPWNSPLALMLWKLCPALAAGNTVVMKPSEVTPVSTLLLAELIQDAGFPRGVVSVVTGGALVGQALVNHPGVDRIAFTGSSSVGKQIARIAGDRLARVSLELGGKSPNIVFEDADLGNAVKGVIAGIFAAAGQTCMAGSRVLLQESIYEGMAEELVARAGRIRLGDPSDPDTEMGPVSCRPQYEKVLRYIDVAKDDGACVLTGGGRPTEPEISQGLFIQPTIIGGVTNDMRIAREEVFGPVAALISFRDEEEAIEIANDSQYGLAAGVWTMDLRRAHRVIHRLHAGTVWVNNYRKTSYMAPFGGYKESGLGRENGLEAINEFTELKTVWIDSGNGIADPFNPRA